MRHYIRKLRYSKKFVEMDIMCLKPYEAKVKVNQVLPKIKMNLEREVEHNKSSYNKLNVYKPVKGPQDYDNLRPS